jgi:hypothetical protein
MASPSVEVDDRRVGAPVNDGVVGTAAWLGTTTFGWGGGAAGWGGGEWSGSVGVKERRRQSRHNRK